MENDEPGAMKPGRRTREDGLRADDRLLRSVLATAPAPFLEGAMANHSLTEDHLVLLLRNNRASEQILARISRNRDWTASYKIKKGLACHPRTPLAISRNILNHLYWRDIREVADNQRLNPVLRRGAESILAVRLAELTQGERITLARQATRGLIEPLCQTGEKRVLVALLENPRLREQDIVLIAEDEETPGEILDRLSQHHVWSVRPGVRKALLRNRRTPVHAAMRILQGMPRRDLERLGNDNKIPRIVRIGAERHLTESGPPGKSPEPRPGSG